jgi:hypothetical protein
VISEKKLPMAIQGIVVKGKIELGRIDAGDPFMDESGVLRPAQPPTFIPAPRATTDLQTLSLTVTVQGPETALLRSESVPLVCPRPLASKTSTELTI